MFNLMILGYLILMLYAYILVNRINKTERKLLIAKEVIDEQNEKIKKSNRRLSRQKSIYKQCKSNRNLLRKANTRQRRCTSNSI